MSSSSAVNHPDFSGKPVTSNWSAGGLTWSGIIHSLGMELNSDDRLAAAISSHDGISVMYFFFQIWLTKQD
jgi:hypothetical protein